MIDNNSSECVCKVQIFGNDLLFCVAVKHCLHQYGRNIAQKLLVIGYWQGTLNLTGRGGMSMQHVRYRQEMCTQFCQTI